MTGDRVGRLGYPLAALAVVGAAIGLLAGGGAGRAVVETARGAEVTLYGHGLYAADTWLVGAGNRGQDVVVLLVEVPALLLALRWHRRTAAPLAAAMLAGVLSFFTYFYLSLTFATAQNRLFPLYVGAAALSGFALTLVTTRLDAASVSQALPARPGRRALAAYLIAVALALTAAWLPGMIGTAVTGDIAEAVGPYTSGVTEALDLGVVVPVVLLAAVLLLRGRPLGALLTYVVLVLNVCIGVLLLGQGIAQLVSDVPLTVGEIIAKMATFATLTFVAGGLLLRGRYAWTSAASPSSTRSSPKAKESANA